MKTLCLFLFFFASCIAEPNVEFVVNGNSMLPALTDGQKLTVKSEKFSDVKRHDFCVYYNPILKKLVIHEAFHRVNGKWEMLGINNPISDPGYMTGKNFVAIVQLKQTLVTRKQTNEN